MAGAGTSDNSGVLVPALHIGGRMLLMTQDSLAIFPGRKRPFLMDRLDLHAETQYQRSSGSSLCEISQRQHCWRTEHLASFGLTSVWPLTPDRHALQVYAIPASLSVHLSVRNMLDRGDATQLAPFGTFEPGSRDFTVGAGIGNGLGVRARVAGRSAILEVKPTLIRFSDGRSGGSMPISLGLAF
ncbi:hypothetical protein BH23GEM6_BH23GEM6_02200 [soil metagenome]